MTTFRDPQLKRCYENCTKTPPRIGPLGEGYRKGKEGLPPQWPRNSLAYAAWAAGRDEMRRAVIAPLLRGED
jgi:hypothetical protein